MPTVVQHTEREKCPNCNFTTTTRYRLTSEPPSNAICGDCFAEWLAITEAEISAPEESG